MSNFNMMGAVGYRISHTDESQDYPIATIKIAFKMPEGRKRSNRNVSRS